MSRIFNDIFDPEVKSMLIAEKIGILKTDTIYGMVALASSKVAVEKIYKIKSRNITKPCIVLIPDITKVYNSPSSGIQEQLQKVWPGKTSVILPAHSAPPHLTRHTNSLAYRIPDDERLRELLKKTGPLIAPSANPEGALPARTIDQAKTYFQDKIDFYVDGGEVKDNTPSRLIAISDEGLVKKLR